MRLTPESSRWPAPRGGALSLRDLDGGEPEVLVGIFTGGANCCYGLYVFRHADGRYRGSFFNAGKGGLVVANLDRRGRRSSAPMSHFPRPVVEHLTHSRWPNPDNRTPLDR